MHYSLFYIYRTPPPKPRKQMIGYLSNASLQQAPYCSLHLRVHTYHEDRRVVNLKPINQRTSMWTSFYLILPSNEIQKASANPSAIVQYTRLGYEYSMHIYLVLVAFPCRVSLWRYIPYPYNNAWFYTRLPHRNNGMLHNVSSTILNLYYPAKSPNLPLEVHYWSINTHRPHTMSRIQEAWL